MHLNTQAIVCAVLGHGEHGAIARLMTHEAELLPGYVRGGRSRRLRPVLLPGNMVPAASRARVPEQLAQLSVELVHSRAPLLAERSPDNALDWRTTITAATLTTGKPYPALLDTLGTVLYAVQSAAAARGCAPLVLHHSRPIL